MDSPVLTTDNLSIGYTARRKTPRIIASALSLTLRAGELVCLLGPNGAGKSTLIRTLAGMQPPLAGQVRLAGNDIATLTPRDLAQHVSVVLTERVDVGQLSVLALVALGRYPYTDWLGRLTARDEAVVRWAIDAVGAAPLAERQVHELSDGERQRVMIARALAQEPLLMILDEPTAFLDLPRRVEIMRLLRTLAHTTGKTMLLSTHDLDLALRSADLLWLMDARGRLHIGAPEDLVLSGAFAATFEHEGVLFDAHAGAFRVNAPMQQHIVLTGEGLAATWTARAMERIGLRVGQSEGYPLAHVAVVNQTEGLCWYVTRNGTTDRLSSMYEVVTLLQQHKQGKLESLSAVS